MSQAKPPVVVDLQELLIAIESSDFEDNLSLVDSETGEVIDGFKSLLSLAEESEDNQPPDHLPTWQKEDWELYLRIAENPDRFLHPPDKFEFHEWQVMKDFTDGIRSDRIRQDLQFALHGNGAFRHFKDKVHRHRIADQWYAYRDKALRDLAIEWCEEHNFKWK